MDYAIVSTFVTDHITLADGSFAGDFPGGAGLYALCGALLWTPSAVLITGVGEDFKGEKDAWFVQNGVAQSGLFVRDAHTAESTVQYQAGAERTEAPPYGPAHYRKMEAAPADIAPHCAGLKGMYVFKDFGPEGYWPGLLELKKKHGFKLEWEMNADLARPEHRDAVRALARQVDVFSLNRTEAAGLLGTGGTEESAALLAGWGVPLVALRAGGSGSLMIADGKVYPVPAVKNTVVVDVTGGGNAASAGVLCGFCAGEHPVEAGLMGSVSAALCIAQYGPPPVGEAARGKAAAMLEQMKQEMRREQC